MSNRSINREVAIKRIKHITNLIKTQQLNQLELLSYELIPSTEATIPFTTSLSLDALPTKVLEETINQPFYRFHNEDIYTLGDSHGKSN